MREIKGTYKCGHTWTEILARGGTKREIKSIQEHYKTYLCPRCVAAAAKAEQNEK